MFVQLTVLTLAGLAGPLLGAARRGLVPVVVGELVAGVVLGRTGFRVVDASAQPLPAFSAIGFAMLMLSAGTRVDVGSPRIRAGFARGAAAFVVVAAGAVPLGVLLSRVGGSDHAALFAVLVAGSSAAIAFPTFDERGLRGDSIPTLIAWIALADAITVLLLPLTLIGAQSIGATLAGDAAIVATGIVVLRVMERLRTHQPSLEIVEQSRARGWAVQVRLSLLLMLGLSAVAERTHGSTLIAGFIAGMVLVRLREPSRLAVQLTGLANGFFVPMFFVLLGSRLDVRALASSPSAMLLAVALVGAAVVAHALAALVTRQRRAVAGGLGASAQLGLPAAAASLGLSANAIMPSTAAAIVAAGCLTLIPAAIGALMLARHDERDVAAATTTGSDSTPVPGAERG